MYEFEGVKYRTWDDSQVKLNTVGELEAHYNSSRSHIGFLDNRENNEYTHILDIYHCNYIASGRFMLSAFLEELYYD